MAKKNFQIIRRDCRRQTHIFHSRRGSPLIVFSVSFGMGVKTMRRMQFQLCLGKIVHDNILNVGWAKFLRRQNEFGVQRNGQKIDSFLNPKEDEIFDTTIQSKDLKVLLSLIDKRFDKLESSFLSRIEELLSIYGVAASNHYPVKGANQSRTVEGVEAVLNNGDEKAINGNFLSKAVNHNTTIEVPEPDIGAVDGEEYTKIDECVEAEGHAVVGAVNGEESMKIDECVEVEGHADFGAVNDEESIVSSGWVAGLVEGERLNDVVVGKCYASMDLVVGERHEGAGIENDDGGVLEVSQKEKNAAATSFHAKQITNSIEPKEVGCDILDLASKTVQPRSSLGASESGRINLKGLNPVFPHLGFSHAKKNSDCPPFNMDIGKSNTPTGVAISKKQENIISHTRGKVKNGCNLGPWIKMKEGVPLHLQIMSLG